MYTIQDIFNRFVELNGQRVLIEGKKWSVTVSGDIVVLTKGNSISMIALSEINERWALKDGKLHYKQFTYMPKQEHLKPAEVETVNPEDKKEIKIFRTADDVIEQLTTNPDYTENVKEIINLFFRANPDSLTEWLDWFNGKPMFAHEQKNWKNPLTEN